MKTILVTGATSGIGLGVVRQLCKTQTTVLGVSLTKNHWSPVLEEAKGWTGRLELFAADVGSQEQMAALADVLLQRGVLLDGLVNAAGTICNGGLLEVGVDDWHRVISSNLTGAFLVSASLVPLFSPDGGSIVHVSSVCSLRPCASIAYSVSKAGVDMLVKCMAKDLAGRRVRVNAVNPGVVRSNLQLSAGVVKDYDEFLQRMKPMHPLGRVGEPIDVASMIMFLLSDQATWITGSIISVDGGRAL